MFFSLLPASATLTGSGATSYTWQTPSGPVFSSVAVVSPTANTTYTLLGSNGVCTSSTTISITVIPAPIIPAPVLEHIKQKSDKIVLTNPLPLQEITSPVTVAGYARGNWFFEASFPVVIVNWDGLIIGQGIATADGEWMTQDFVPFTASIEFKNNQYDTNRTGLLILKKDNPSGLSENDDSLEIPIIFTK